MKQIKWIFSIVMVFLLTACTNPNSPEGIAKKFWDGVMSQNQEVVRQYSTTATASGVDFSKNTIDWKTLQTNLGTTEISGNTAMVHTLIVNKETGARYAFNTYLEQENGLWRVDYVKTRKASITSEIFADIIVGLKKFNQALVDNFDDTVDGFREAAPEIKKELDQLTQTLANHMREASKQGNQTVHSKMQDFKDDVMDIFVHHSDHPADNAPATAQ